MQYAILKNPEKERQILYKDGYHYVVVKDSRSVRAGGDRGRTFCGIARKNVNSAATVLDTPISRAPTIVAPEREVPGKIAAISWNTPISVAV